MYKLIAMDMDGTLTQHRTPLSDEHRAVLQQLSAKYKLLMVGAGQVSRIFRQLGEFPIDIVGNYGMQYGVYNAETAAIDIVRDDTAPCDRASVTKRVTELRNTYGYTAFTGDNVEFHPSGCVTIPLLGTKAAIEDKLAFDPDRSKRRAFYADVCRLFSEYTVFVGGSSSFDMAPKPYDKRYALELYCKEHGLSPDQVVFIGDDYGPGGNDESVYRSDFGFITIDDYRTFPEKVRHLL